MKKLSYSVVVLSELQETLIKMYKKKLQHGSVICSFMLFPTVGNQSMNISSSLMWYVICVVSYLARNNLDERHVVPCGVERRELVQHAPRLVLRLVRLLRVRRTRAALHPRPHQEN